MQLEERLEEHLGGVEHFFELNLLGKSLNLLECQMVQAM